MTKPTQGSPKAKKLARSLLRANRRGYSWRQIAADYPGVHFATLNRIANSGGEWLPKDDETLIALGLKKLKPTGPRLPSWLQPEALPWYIGQREKVKGMHKEMKEEIKRRTR